MKSLTFNGIRKDWLYLLEGRQKAPFAPITRNLLKIPGRPGALLQSSEIEPLVIYQPIGFVVKNDIDALTKKDELASWLVTMEPVALEFDDEPGRIYYAVVQNTVSDYEKFVRQRRGIIEFLVLDGFGYGPEHEVTFPFDVVTLTNEGTAEADPIFELEVKEPVTFAMIQNQNEEYMMIGKPAEVDQQIVDEKTQMLSERGETLSEWTTDGTQVDGTVAGTLTTDGTGIVVQSYGTATGWHGPALMKEITPIQDFEVAMRLRVEATNPNTTYRIEFYLFDEFMNVLGKMAIMDASQGSIQYSAEGRIGPFVGKQVNYLISSRNYQRDRAHFHGMLRMRRIGKRFEFYVARIGHTSEEGYIHHDTLTEVFNDVNNQYQGRLRYVQIHIGKYGNTPEALTPRINAIEVFEHKEVLADQTPYIAYPGDQITFDHKNKDILINGESRMDLKQFGASFFKLKRGFNQLVIMPGEAFVAKCRYREKYR